MTPDPQDPRLLSAERLFFLIRCAVRDGFELSEAVDIERAAAGKMPLNTNERIQDIMGKVRWELRAHIAALEAKLALREGECDGKAKLLAAQSQRYAERERLVAELIGRIAGKTWVCEDDDTHEISVQLYDLDAMDALDELLQLTPSPEKKDA